MINDAVQVRSTKRARPQTSSPAKLVRNENLDCHSAGLVNDDLPRRKRAMINLRIIEKMPLLRDYERGRFGRRGGVDGGALDGDRSLWIQALEDSMDEVSFVNREPPSRAALVAPLSVPIARATYHNLDRNPSVPFTPLRLSHADEEGMRRRRLYALQAALGGGKDDEARPATEGLV